MSNEYLNVQNGKVRDPSTLAPGQQRITQEEYNEIVVQQLTELWSHYGNEPRRSTGLGLELGLGLGLGPLALV